MKLGWLLKIIGGVFLIPFIIEVASVVDRLPRGEGLVFNWTALTIASIVLCSLFYILGEARINRVRNPEE